MASTLNGFQSSGFTPVGTPKTPVYAAPVNNEEALHHRAVDVCQTLHLSWQLRMDATSMIRRFENALATVENVWSTYYKNYLSTVNKNLFPDTC
jgi:hypothetical protein